jgi:hypothetical protein
MSRRSGLGLFVVANRAGTNEAREDQMNKWHARVAHLVAAMAVAMSALLIPAGPVPTVEAAPSGFHDASWTEFSKSGISRYTDGFGYQFGVYSVAAEWQGKRTTPLIAPSVGDVFYVHIFTEVYNTWSATFRMRVLMPAGLQLVSPTATHDVYCEISNLNNVEIRSPGLGECAAPYMFGSYAMFPAVASGINERIHFWFPVTATQPMSGVAGDMQVLADQTNAPAISFPNPTLTTTRLQVVAPSPTAPAAPTGLSASAGNGSATISFTPGSNGGSAITNYQYTLNNGTTWTAFSPADTTSPVTITGLTNGTTYNVRLRAVSTIAGAASASVTVALPVITPPPIIFIPPIILLPPITYVPPPYTPPSTPPPSAPPPSAPPTSPPSLSPANVAPFLTVDPSRIYDSRSTPGGRPAGSVTEVAVAGRAGVPSDVEGVVLNVTAVNARAPGYMTVFPCGSTPPDASNLNYAAGQTIPNSVIAKMGAGGNVCVYTSAQVDLLVDVNGSLPAGSDVNPLDPSRLYDSRAGDGPRPDGSVTVVQVAGRGGVPADATTAVLNVTALDASAPGYMTVFPCGTAPPDASNLNFPIGATIANSVIAKLDDAGQVCVFTSGSAGLLVDVGGYISGASGYSGLTPLRLFDSRQTGGVRAAGTVTEIDIYGSGAVPAGASAVVLNATAVGALAPGFMTVFPCGTNPPDASNLNFSAGQTIPNSVVAKVGAGGKVCVFTSAPTHLLVDVGGYTKA